MPLPGFLSSVTEKAQRLAQSTPLAGHIPGTHQTPDQAAEGPTANEAAAQGGYAAKGNHTLESIQHQLRQFGQQYTSTSPVQKIITTTKGVSIDVDSLARDAKASSKELYTWGQGEDEDIKDVTDRLAFMNYVHGSLASTLATSLNEARTPMKELRDAENQLAPRRAARANLESQIAKMEHAQDAKSQARFADARDQLARAKVEDEPQEKEIMLLKRKGVRESEIAKWNALREFGEKLVLVAQAATIVAQQMPATPPTPNQPYLGAAATAGARAQLQRALDNYRTGHIHLPSHQDSLDSHASSTASFGETHGDELRSLDTADASHITHPSVPLTPPANAPTHPQSILNMPAPTQTSQPAPHPPAAVPMPIPSGGGSATHSASAVHATSPPVTSPVINPALLNQSPAPLPTSPPMPSATTTVPVADPASDHPAKLPSITPTVAETGIPVHAADPGPASGSLKDLHKDSAGTGTSTVRTFEDIAPAPADVSPAVLPPPVAAVGVGHEGAEEEKKRLEREERERVLAGMTSAGNAQQAHAQPPYESAEDEKKRLQREERERLLAGEPNAGAAQQSHAQPPYESAEDEKKRLEREERERILAGQAGQGGANQQPRRGTGPDGDDLPPYQEPTLM